MPINWQQPLKIISFKQDFIMTTTNNKHYHLREDCRLCLSKDVVLAVPFKPTPLAEKYVLQKPSKPQDLYPVDLYMCQNCGHVQILDVIDPEILWQDYTYHSGQTQGIIEHFEEIVKDTLARFELSDNQLVIDVGSNDGSLLKAFKNRNFKVLGIDPAVDIAKKASANGIETIAELMTPSEAKKMAQSHGKAGIVTAFNVFAHADEMRDLLESISIVLDEDGLFVFEVSYLLDIVEKMLLGTIFHEHLCHHSLHPMKIFLESRGLELIDVQRVSIQGGSLVGYAQFKGGKRPVHNSVNEVLQLEEQNNLHQLSSMQAFAKRIQQMSNQVRELLSQYQGQEIAGYGAARSGPMFIAQFGLSDALQYLFDDHPQKVGMLSPGDLLPVLETAQLEQKHPALTFILAWVHAKKIIRKHKAYLEQGGTFVLLTPEIKLVTIDDYSEYETQ